MNRPDPGVAGHENSEPVLLRYCERRHAQILSKLRLVAIGKNDEALHAFRVGSKKLRTTRGFAGYLLSRPLDRDRGYRAIRRVYRASGATRDYQLQLKLLPIYERRIGRRFKPLKRSLRKGEKRARQHTRDVLFGAFPDLRTRPAKAARRQLTRASRKQLAKKGRAYVRQQLALATKAAESRDVQDLHEVRKTLKNVFYVSRLLDRIADQGADWRHSQIERYDLLQEALGDWHDLLQFEARLPVADTYDGLRDSVVVGDRELLETSIWYMLRDLAATESVGSSS